MAEKEIRSEEQLIELLREAVQHEPVPLTGAQFIKIVQADSVVHGANWIVSHSGEPGGHHVAIDRAYARLKEKFDLALTTSG